MIRLYEILFCLLFFLLTPVLLFFPRIRNTFYKRLYLTRRRIDTRRSILFHGASAGDILSIRPVIESFFKRFKDQYDILITTNTESGVEIVKRYFSKGVLFDYLPFDLFFSVENFLDSYRPVLFIVEASEFWPVLIERAHRRGIKIVLVNGNIKREKVMLYKVLSYLTSNIFKKYDLMIMRNEESYKAAISLGVDEKRLNIMINTKYKNVFDMREAEFPAHLKERYKKDNLLVFGSIHYEEEEDVLYIVNKIFERFRTAKVLFAPRHLERVEPVFKRLLDLSSSKGLTLSRFSEKKNTDICVLDTMGDLFYIYSFARVAFVGGSLVDKGGHNLLEPAVWGVPVVTGRYIGNYEDLAKRLLGYGLIVSENRDHILEAIMSILEDEDKRRNLSELLLQRIEALRGELLHLNDVVERMLSI